MGNEDTIVLDQTLPAAGTGGAQRVEESVSTRVISKRSLTCDSVPFDWWAVGEDPSLVTVRSPIFGRMADFTRGDAGEFAMILARRLLEARYRRAARLREAEKKSPPTEDVLTKTGWFGSKDKPRV